MNKQKRYKRKISIIAIILLLGTCFFVGFVKYQEDKNAKANFYAKPSLEIAKDGTSISPGHHNFVAYKQILSKQYPNIYKATFETPMVNNEGANAIIPGQVVTKSYDFRVEKVTKTKTMTPQGLTIAGPYILITAYDSEYAHASVIYILNKRTNKYLKTIQVVGTPHLGGITYDPKAQNIWVTGSQGDQAALMSFSLKKLKDYDYSKKKTPIKYDYEITLPTIERASCVTYFDNQLFVGFFNQYGKGQIAAYPIAREKPFKDTITSDQIKAVTGQVSWTLGSGSTNMDRQIQGIAFYNNWIILSQSYGSSNSKLYFFPISAINNLDENNAEKVVIMPPYLEQIYANQGQLLMLFESGAKAYAKENIMVMDRILSTNINALLGS